MGYEKAQVGKTPSKISEVGLKLKKFVVSRVIQRAFGYPTNLRSTAIFIKLNYSRITNAPIADAFVIWARHVEDKRIKGVVLRRDSPGLRTSKIQGKFSLRASETGMIFMDNVKISEDQILPKALGLSVSDC